MHSTIATYFSSHTCMKPQYSDRAARSTAWDNHSVIHIATYVYRQIAIYVHELRIIEDMHNFACPKNQYEFISKKAQR